MVRLRGWVAGGNAWVRKTGLVVRLLGARHAGPVPSRAQYCITQAPSVDEAGIAGHLVGDAQAPRAIGVLAGGIARVGGDEIVGVAARCARAGDTRCHRARSGRLPRSPMSGWRMSTSMCSAAGCRALDAADRDVQLRRRCGGRERSRPWNWRRSRLPATVKCDRVGRSGAAAGVGAADVDRVAAEREANRWTCSPATVSALELKAAIAGGHDERHCARRPWPLVQIGACRRDGLHRLGTRWLWLKRAVVERGRDHDGRTCDSRARARCRLPSCPVRAG